MLQGSVLATLQSKLISGASGVLFGLLGKLGDKDAINAAADSLGGAIYQLYRHAPPGRRRQRAPTFALDPAGLHCMGTPTADMKLARTRLRPCAGDCPVQKGGASRICPTRRLTAPIPAGARV
ncbi:MAG: hypothetical protein ACLU38_02800 [Dysosmobacter sp.]